MYVTTRRRFEGIGENHGFSACREYHFSGHERVLVLLRSHPAVGREHRCGGQNPDELRPHGGAVPFHTVHEAVCRPAACPVLSGYEGCQGRENHLEKNMDGTRHRVRAVFPELVDTGSAVAGRSGDGAVYHYHRYRLCLPFDGRSVDEPSVETQSDGGCFQQ